MAPIPDSSDRRPPAPGEGCLSNAELEGLLDRSLAADLLSRLEAHVAACGRCSAELELLKTFCEAVPAPGEAADVDWIVRRLQTRLPEQAGVSPATKPPVSESEESKGSLWRGGLLRPRWRFVPVLAAAAALILVAALEVQRRLEPGLRVPGAGQAVLRSGRVPLKSPVGDIDSLPERLEWVAVGGARRYVVTVMEVDRNVLWRAETEMPGIDVPPQVRAAAVPGKTLLWQVEAFDPAGSRVAESGVERFRVQVSPGREPWKEVQ